MRHTGFDDSDTQEPILFDLKDMAKYSVWKESDLVNYGRTIA